MQTAESLNRFKYNKRNKQKVHVTDLRKQLKRKTSSETARKYPHSEMAAGIP